MKGYLRQRDRRQNRSGPCKIWQLVVHLGYDENKKRHVLYRTFHGKKSDAQIALDELKADVRSGAHMMATDFTFSYALERWLSVKRHESTCGEPPPIDQQTVEQYSAYARVHLTPAFGPRKLRDIKNYDVRSLLEHVMLRGRKNRSQASGYSLTISTVRRIRFVLNSVFEYACNMGWLAQNPVTRVKLPRQSSSDDFRVLDDEEAGRLVKAARGTRLYLPILLASVTGARRGEILALTWDDVDFETAEIHIRTALRHDGSVKRPKSKSGTRKLLLPNEVAVRLLDYREQKTAEAADWNRRPAPFLFSEVDGRPWKPDSISTLFRRIVRDANIGKVKFHELRHSLASILLADGTDIASVAKILGHADKAFTMRRYVHATSSNDAKADSVIRRRASVAA